MASATMRDQPPQAYQLLGGSSWADDVKAYERSRREVDTRFMQRPGKPLESASLAHAERAFNPLLQRFSDDAREAAQRRYEEKVRVKHLNLAADVQLRREQPFNVVTNNSRLGSIDNGQSEFQGMCNARLEEPMPMPGTCADYNIVSNQPFSKHHWARPEDRPRCVERHGKPRQIPSYSKKDFNPLTNRYLEKHEEKMARDKALSLLEATNKYREQSAFDPVVQQFTDARREEVFRTLQDAQVVKGTLIAETQIPPSHRARQSAHYDVVAHKVKDAKALRAMDDADDQRKERLKTRYIAENSARERDIAFQEAQIEQKLSAVAHERFTEVTSRGFDIINNKNFGEGHGRQQVFAPMYTKPRVDQLQLWDRMQSADDDATDRAQPVAGKQFTVPIRLSQSHGRSPQQPADRSLAGPSSARGSSGRHGGRGSSVPLATSGDRRAGVQALSARGPGYADPPPAPAVPGSSHGSVYSRPRE